MRLGPFPTPAPETYIDVPIKQYGWFYETQEAGMGSEGRVWRWTLYEPGPGVRKRRALWWEVDGEPQPG